MVPLLKEKYPTDAVVKTEIIIEFQFTNKISNIENNS